MGLTGFSSSERKRKNIYLAPLPRSLFSLRQEKVNEAHKVEMLCCHSEHRERAGAGDAEQARDAKQAMGRDRPLPSLGVPAPCSDVIPCPGLGRTQALRLPALPSCWGHWGGRRTLRCPTTPPWACKAFPCSPASPGMPQAGGPEAVPTPRLCFGCSTVCKAGVGTGRLHLQSTLVFFHSLIMVF